MWWYALALACPPSAPALRTPLPPVVAVDEVLQLWIDGRPYRPGSLPLSAELVTAGPPQALVIDELCLTDCWLRISLDGAAVGDAVRLVMGATEHPPRDSEEWLIPVVAPSGCCDVELPTPDVALVGREFEDATMCSSEQEHFPLQVELSTLDGVQGLLVRSDDGTIVEHRVLGARATTFVEQSVRQPVSDDGRCFTVSAYGADGVEGPQSEPACTAGYAGGGCSTGGRPAVGLFPALLLLGRRRPRQL